MFLYLLAKTTDALCRYGWILHENYVIFFSVIVELTWQKGQVCLD